MKLSNIIIAVILIITMVIGWVSFVMQTAEQDPYDVFCEEAESYFAEGLFQRAILKWEDAYVLSPSEDIYKHINEAYELRYVETASETKENYMEFLQRAVDAYPANQTFVDAYLDFYWKDKEYVGVYECLVGAITNGYDNESLRSLLHTVKYMSDLSDGYIELVQSVDGYYTYSTEEGMNVRTPENNALLLSPHKYAGIVGEENITVVTDYDSRIINGEGIVLGIFEKKVSDAGIFAEGLVPAFCDGQYNYYDEFAVMRFGGYDAAGMFQNGFAAVKKDGKWFLINTNGERESDQFEEIVLDNAGRYLINGTVLVKNSDGKYSLYDADWEKLSTLDCTDVDINTADGLIAVCKDGKWGYMNTSGEMVIEPQYDAAKSFSNCSAAVCKNGLWGFIDVNNDLVIPCQFEDAGYMDSNGICPVKRVIIKEEEPVISLTPSDGDPENGIIIDPEETEEPKVETPWSFLKLTIGVRRDNL